MKHSEFAAGAKIQQFVAKYGAAITSSINASLPRKLALLAMKFWPNWPFLDRNRTRYTRTFADTKVKGIFTPQAFLTAGREISDS